MTKEEIGQILKELRLSCGKTQKEVAELLGRKQQIVGHWETGYSQPDANTLFTLCDIYGTTVDAAFGFKKSDIVISKKDIELLKKYQKLDELGKETIDILLDKEIEKADKIEQLKKRLCTYDEKLREIRDNKSPTKHLSLVAEKSGYYANAAHADEESTPEERKAGDDIMTDDSEWE